VIDRLEFVSYQVLPSTFKSGGWWLVEVTNSPSEGGEAVPKKELCM